MVYSFWSLKLSIADDEILKINAKEIYDKFKKDKTFDNLFASFIASHKLLDKFRTRFTIVKNGKNDR
jgi:hypothetical protein